MKRLLKKFTLWMLILSFTLIVTTMGACDIVNIVKEFLGIEVEDELPPPSQTASLEGLTEVAGEFTIHFMTMDNKYTGDCIFIEAGEYDILIDIGTKSTPIEAVDDYIDDFVTDNTLEFVIVTHADQDHIKGFTGSKNIFTEYVCETIIDFPISEKSTAVYAEYIENRDNEVEEGAKHYTALECYNNLNGAKRVYELTDNISFEILYNYFYENDADDENNYSVCVMFKHGDRQFLFTGDLEEEGEEKLAEYYDFTDVVFYKAGHHGSKTSSNDILLKEIKPKICVASCVAGTPEYTETQENQFPTQAFIDRISKYTDRVFVPLQVEYLDNGEYSFKEMNGDITIKSYGTKVDVICSNNSKFLKDTEWFKTYRTTPPAWQQTA